MEQIEKSIAVSVIVPVYNVEKYLHQCLSSLVQQQLDYIEVIIVNDGSTDLSQLIIDEYAAKYPFLFSTYIKENGGLGAARNLGLGHARGKYIGFVDSDDWIEPEMFREMYEAAKNFNADVVICDFLIEKNGFTSQKVNGYRGRKADQGDISEYVQASLNPATACNKLFSKELFNNRWFPEIWYEDMALTPVLLSYAKSIIHLNKPLYHYRKRSDSIISQRNDPRILEVCQAWELELEKGNPKYYDELLCAVYQSIGIFMDFKPEYMKEFRTFAEQMKEDFSGSRLINSGKAKRELKDVFSRTYPFEIKLRNLLRKIRLTMEVCYVKIIKRRLGEEKWRRM